ncbi:MAG TPA: malto-oligosyltrehalose trehalohydrolase [Candidatus Angelobacter sp.]
MLRRHNMPFGAECTPDGQVRFRLWAPTARHVNVCLIQEVEDQCLPMAISDGGWFESTTRLAGPGTRYKFQIDGGLKVADPASRFQPEDVHGPSGVVDPSSFDWEDQLWRGRPWEEAVLYELHVGTFSPEGTFAGVEQRLQYLADLGVTAVELMPLADFRGARNWGYDGVFLFAPDSRYGRPNDLKHLIQTAHRLGLMVFLDVVYNHFGPDGNYLREYAPQFFTDRYRTPWGEAINYDGPDSRTVREFFVHNALYWLSEYHFDGLRLDAVHQIFDQSPCHFLNVLAETVRTTFAPDRFVHLVLENDDNAARYLERGPKREARIYTAQWNDDFHHALHVAITGESDGYYSDYADRPVERLARCLAEGFDYQGQESPFRGNEKRGGPSRDLPPVAFVSFSQNHDQVGNRAFGERMISLAEPRAVQAALAIQLLSPSPPLLFMGEEFGAETPFLFFCDFGPDLAQRVTEGRRKEFSRFERFSGPATQARIPDPNAESTFLRSKLDWESLDRGPSQHWLNTYRTLLSLRQRYITPLLPGIKLGGATFRTLGERAIEISWPTVNGGALTVVANLSDEPVLNFSPPDCEMFYSTPSENAQENQLAAWSVRWFLRS